MRLRSLRAWLALAGVVVAGEILTIAPRPATIAIVAAGVWMALPGVPLLRAFFGERGRAAAWMFGPAVGIGLSVFGTFLWWAAGLQNWLAVALGPALTLLVTLILRRTGGARLRLPASDRRDVFAVALVLLIVPLVTWLPYDHVREPAHGGEAYRAYFTADFIWAMTVTAEVARGDVPPHNPFLTDQPLHYYWMAHFLSGALYRQLQPSGVPVEQVVLIDGLLFGLAFSAFFYGLVRTAGAGPLLSALAVATGYLANSYEGADMIRAIVQHGQPWSDLTITNIDAVTRWFYKGMAVDGLQRLLLYQPHHLTGYALGLAALWLVGLAEDVTESSVALGAGILLGLSLLFSTFIALILGSAVGLLYALRLVQQGALRSVLQCAILGAAPVALGLGITMALGYTDRAHGSLLILGLNPVAVRNVRTVFGLSFGPLLLAAVASLFRWRWLLGAGAPATAMTVASLAFYFFTNVPDSGDVWVGWRSGHLLLIAFSVMAAAVVDAAWRSGRFRPATAIAVVAALLLAVPTVAIDIYNAQDITNRGEGAGFPWTLVITREEREALDWIKHQTKPDAVVQTEPHIRTPATWAYIPAFAERRTAAGLPGSMTPIKPYQDRSQMVLWGIFRAVSADEAYNTARFLKIDYLALGRPERGAYPALAQLTSRPDLFPIVFENAEMTVLQVRP